MRRWTEHEENLLVALYLNDFTCVQICRILGRTKMAVKGKYYHFLKEEINRKQVSLAIDIANNMQKWRIENDEN